MKISVGPEPFDGMFEIAVTYSEMSESGRETARVMVRVAECDSYSELQSRALDKARNFLELALAAHSATDKESLL